MLKSLQNAVSELKLLLDNFTREPDNPAHAKQYVAISVSLSRTFTASFRDSIAREVVNCHLPAETEGDAELFALLSARRAFAITETPFPEKAFLSLHRRALSTLSEPETDAFLMTIPSHILYEKVAMAVATGRRGSFDRAENDKWPTHHIDENALQANILVRPSDKTPVSLLEASPQYTSLLKLMNERVDNMDELTMDVMHIICARWLESSPNAHTEQIRLTADDILEARGVQRHLNGDGKRYGYTQEQRAAIQERMAALSCIWVSVNNMTVTVREGGKRTRKSTRYESPALVITGRFGEVSEDGDVELWTWNVRPGDVFSAFLLNPASREVGFFPKQSLLYDPKYQSWEKRLSFYLSWQTRVRRHRENQAFTYKTGTLLEAIHEEVDTAHPGRTRDRLETALDKLQKDGLLHSWQYAAGCDESALPPRKWVNVWLDWKINLHPASDTYNLDYTLTGGASFEQLSFGLDNPDASALPAPGHYIKALRTRDGFTQQQFAEKLGVARSLISQIEAGKRKVSPELTKKIRSLDTSTAASKAGDSTSNT